MLKPREIRELHDIVKVVEGYGLLLKPRSGQLWACCPFHKEDTASFKVNEKYQTFNCFGCGARGDVIDFTARMDGIKQGDAMLKLTPPHLRERAYSPSPSKPKPLASPQIPCEKGLVGEKLEYKLTDTYTYTDEFGNELYQIEKLVANEGDTTGKRKKKFNQKHLGANGQWVYSMEGVVRVLYNLPNVKKSQVAVLCEGEKDCETLNKIGLVATTNPGGAEKWLDSYSDYLVGKDLIIFGDNDEAGRKHVTKVLAAVAGKVKTARVCYMPEGKDVTEFKDILIKRGKSESDFSSELEKLVSSSVHMERGFDLPIYSMEQMESFYRNDVNATDDKSLDLGKLLPTLGRTMEPLIGGDLLVIMADTGVGKSFLSQLLMIAARPLKSLFFQIELSRRRTFERFAAIDTGMAFKEIKRIYKSGQSVGWSRENMGHIYTIPISRLTTARIEQLIGQSELVMGERPAIVVVDYAQLVEGIGKSQYEKISSVAEQLKIIAVATNTIIILTSQVGRSEDEQYKELSLHDAKNSGSIEQSSTVLLGLYLDRDVEGKMYCKVIKDSNSDSAGMIVECMRKGMRLVEVSKVEVEEGAL